MDYGFNDCKLNGICCQTDERCFAFYILDFTKEIKYQIKKYIIEICWGISDAKNPSIMKDYKNTMKELYKRISEKNREYQIGMIGELIEQLLIKLYFPAMTGISVFFNLEEQSIKKGFDLTLVYNNEIWINEVKSGETDDSVNNKITSLVDCAKRDLKKRLNDDNMTLWYNAINHVRCCFNELQDEKKTAESLINSKMSDIYEDPNQCINTNVVLTAVLFHDLKNKFDYTVVESKNKEIDTAKIFQRCIVIAIQKGTIDKIIQFIKEESSNE